MTAGGPPVARLALVAACVLVVSGCGDDGKREARSPPAQAQPAADVFRYDAAAPLQLADRGRVNDNYPIEVRDISYASRGRRVQALLVLPPGRGPFPAVVYAHGSGQNRVAFVAQATWVAARGAVALTLDQPSEQGPNPSPDALTALRRQRDRTVAAVVDFRRAVDLLQSLPQVDDKRIGFVGFSAGARTGAILAGVERRFGALVLMSGGASPVSEYVEPLRPELRAPGSALLADVDPLRYVARAAPAALLFQTGRRDEIVPKAALEALARAASEPKRVTWYSAGHGLNIQAFRDQLDWLAKELDIAGPPVPGAITGP